MSYALFGRSVSVVLGFAVVHYSEGRVFCEGKRGGVVRTVHMIRQLIYGFINAQSFRIVNFLNSLWLRPTMATEACEIWHTGKLSILLFRRFCFNSSPICT